MKALIALACLGLAGCATQGAFGPPTRHLQIKDPISGKPVTEVSMASAEGCRLAQVEVVKKQQLRRAEDVVQCSATSIASELPYRATLRVATTDTLMDWHFVTMTFCEQSLKSPDAMAGLTLVAACARK